MLVRLHPESCEFEFNELKDRYAHLRSVMDDMISGVMVVDKKGQVLLVNSIVLRYLGLSEADCVGQSVETLFPRTAEIIMQRVHAVLQSGQAKTYEDQLRLSADDIRWLLLTYQPAYDNRKQIYAVQIQSLDITEQRQAQLELLQTKLLLDKSQQMAKIGSWQWRLRDNRITCSDELIRIHGFDPAETIDVSAMMAQVHPDDRAMFDQTIMDSLENKRPFRLNYRIVRKDGTVVWLNSQSELLRNAKGQLTKVWGVVQDITDRMQAEQKRIELEEQLQQSQKMEAIGTLAGGIAHDFNNILSSIIGFTELAMDDVEPGTLPHENLEDVLKSGQRAKELVRHILTFSRQSETERKPIRLSAIVEETVRMLRATIPAFIKLRVEDLAGNSTIMGDESQIRQVILNLCTNSAHAMEDSGGTMVIRLEAYTAGAEGNSLRPEKISGQCLKLTVTDTGCGIVPELIDRIFEPYMTTKACGKGTGLGLSVVHGIVQSHKGVIFVKTIPGQGTTMEVVLPLIDKAVENEITAPAVLCEGDEHILLVDDELPIVKIHQRALERYGYTVTARTSSIEAFEAFQSNPGRFDAVITDMTMPNMNGDQLAKKIKAIRPDIPVIICTGYSEKLSDNSMQYSGIDLFLLKPVGRTDLANGLRRLMDHQSG